MCAEEELKRLHKALGSKSYGEVAFNYDDDSGPGKIEEKAGGEPTEEEVEGGDEPFMAPPELDIPINMTLVSTVVHRLYCRHYHYNSPVLPWM